MSCITEILKLKGEQKVFLPLDEDGTPWIAVEGGGTYKDHEYIIVLNQMGHRCGYVAIKPEHRFDSTPLEKREFLGRTREHYDYDSLNIDCHGGLTFMDRHHGLKDLLTTPCNDFWIGFDCGHYGDACDIKHLMKYFGEKISESRRETCELLSRDGYVKDFQYTEKVCHDIIDQLIEHKEAA